MQAVGEAVAVLEIVLEVQAVAAMAQILVAVRQELLIWVLVEEEVFLLRLAVQAAQAL